MKKVLKITLMAVIAAVLLAFSAYAADDLVFTFEDENSVVGWHYENLNYQFVGDYFEGYAVELQLNLSDPIVYSPTLNIKAEDYPYIIVTMKYVMDATWSRNANVYFQTPSMSGFQSGISVESDYLEDTELWEYKDFVFDMSSHEDWKGTIKAIRFDPFGCPGSINIKSIRFTNKLPEVEKEPEQPDDVGTGSDKPAKQIGVFEKVNEFTSGTFYDIPENEWYAKEVANAYVLGLVNGKGAGAFEPNSGITIAEAITLASRMRNAYGTADYDFTAAAGEQWYAPYVKYAIDNGIIAEGDFANFNAAATRAEMAYIFAQTLPSTEYAYINGVASIPDVQKNSKYYTYIYKLYNAGIVMGSDAYGNFYPESGIKRCEAAAIMNRLSNKENRLSKNLLSLNPVTETGAFIMSSEAKHFIDDERFYNRFKGGIASGWWLDQTLTAPSAATLLPDSAKDLSEEYGYTYFKKFMAVTDGVLDLEFGARMYGSGGAYIAFADASGNHAVEVAYDKGEYKVLAPDGSYTLTGVPYTNSTVHFNIHANLDSNTFILSLDGAYIGTYPFAADIAISELHYGTTEKGKITIAADYAYLRHNFLTLEKFANAPSNVLPYNVETISENGKVTKESIYTERSEGGTVALNAEAYGKAGIKSSFTASTGNVVFETYVFMDGDINGAKIALKSAGTDAFYLETKDGNFLAPDGSVVKYYTNNLWHIVRFEADTATGTALVKINGKEVGTYAFANNVWAIDGYEITYSPSVKARMLVDNISAFVKLPYPDDYVPVPQIPESDDYFVGLNVCSMWREGTHRNWDTITAYPEIEPVLGFYDEGTPEVSDWEIKMMAEHGIDYEIFCWYADANITKPIMRTDLVDGLIDGYMNARYSDMLDFAIMWENSSINVYSFEAWKEYVVPYWIEYFFKDERYVRFNGKPLLTVWSIGGVEGAFGDTSSKEAFDYLREECVKAGLGGCEIMLYHNTDYTEAAVQRAIDAGFDSMGPYHWGTSGSDPDKQLQKLETLKNTTAINTIPAVSVGFDYVGWGNSEQRNGLLDPKYYSTITDYIKNQILAPRDKSNDYGNAVIISTWNEYGEGTYVMPTKRFGFSYLDGVRSAFTSGGAHEDATPTPEQKQRINYLYDQSRQLLRPQLLEKEELEQVDPYEGAKVIHSITFKTAEDVAKLGNYDPENFKLTCSNGKLVIPAYDKPDPAIFLLSDMDGVPTKEADGLRVRAKITASDVTKGEMQMYYYTNNDKGFVGERGAGIPTVVGEWHDFYFDMRNDNLWKDLIVNFRIDVTNFAFEQVEIESIDFVKLPTGPDYYTVDINGKVLDLVKLPQPVGDNVMIPVWPGSGVFGRMMATYTWDKYTQTLTVENASHTVTHIVGTDVYTVDGVDRTASAESYYFDGLPVLAIDEIAEGLGLFVVEHEDKNGISIMINSADDYEIIKTRVPYEYEFNIFGDLEDFTPQASDLSVKDGTLIVECGTSDPAVFTPASFALNADKYPFIKVRVRNTRADADIRPNYYMNIFFRNATKGYHATRNVSSTPISGETDGEFIEYTFDMSKNLQWTGYITGVRFDPIQFAGTSEIDYIRFCMDENMVLAEEMAIERALNVDDTIANGDAEIFKWNPMTSGNADVEIVERHDGLGYCYKVTAKYSNAYTQCNQKVKFVPGATYEVQFDARITSRADGATEFELGSVIVPNLRYSGGGSMEHVKPFVDKPITIGNGWMRFKTTMTVDSSCDNLNDELSIYLNPVDGIGFNFELDNIILKRVDG